MQSNPEKLGNPENVLTPSKEPLRVYGNPKAVSTNKNFGMALLTGLAIGIALMAVFRK